jgi:hypothetical protein
MSAFIRRGRTTPSATVLTEIEQIYIVDGVQNPPVVGVGTGTLLLVGEFEDGTFNKPTEVYGEESEATTFGGFGYKYGDTLYQNPCARIRLGEYWNGNGWIKGKYLKPNRKIICRVNTSVGDVRFTLAAALTSRAGPFALSAGDSISVTTDTGTASSTAITAVVATKTGAVLAEPVLLTGGERIGLTVDSLTEVVITFQATDVTRALVAARINSFMGYTAVTVSGSNELVTVGIVQGTSGSVTYRDIDAGTLAIIGLNATPATGTGNVADVSAVTATEAKALIDVAAIIAVNGDAINTADNEVIVFRTGSAAGTILIATGAMATEMGFSPLDTTITGNIGDETPIPAGTRVRNAGGDEWVTMRTIYMEAGTASVPSSSTYDVEVRPATDDGSATQALAGTVTTLVDPPPARFVEVTNPSNISAALSEPTIDSRYQTALTATLNPDEISCQATLLLIARRSAAVVRYGRSNAISASEEECYGRKYHTRAQFGLSTTAAIADVALYRSDRVFYTYPGLLVTYPEIAELGVAGGSGFTADGEILIGADGPLAYVNSFLNPEENPGQDTQKLDFINGLEEITGFVRTIALYKAFKAAGICAPTRSKNGNIVFQSEVTTSLEPGRKTQKRRKMADFIQDSIVEILYPESKKLATDDREGGIDALIDGFLDGLLSPDDASRQRIKGYSVTNTTDENPDLAANGVSVRKVEVQMLPSLDTFLVQTEIGEGVVIAREI